MKRWARLLRNGAITRQKSPKRRRNVSKLFELLGLVRSVYLEHNLTGIAAKYALGYTGRITFTSRGQRVLPPRVPREDLRRRDLRRDGIATTDRR